MSEDASKLSKYRLDPENVDKVVECVKLVKFIVNERFSAYYEYRDDIIQEGVIGLIKAVKNYDDSKPGAKFSTYASICIRNEIQKFVSERTDPIRVPVAVKLAINGIREISDRNGSEQERNEYLKKIQVSPNMYNSGKQASLTLYLDDTTSEGVSYHDILSVEMDTCRNIVLEDKKLYCDFHNFLNFNYPDNLLNNRIYVNYVRLYSSEFYNMTEVFRKLKKEFNVNNRYVKSILAEYEPRLYEFLEYKLKTDS